MEDVAKAARLSKMTVSRAITNRGYVSDKTRRKVMRAAKELNYELNFIGRQLNQNRTCLFGVATHLEGLLGSWYFGEILAGIQKELTGTDYHVALVDMSRAPFQTPSALAQLCHQRRMDGFILVAPHLHDPCLSDMSGVDVPFVVVGATPQGENLSYVDIANYQGMREATQHLIKLGHRRIAYFGGPAQVSDASQRELGFRKAMAEANLPIRREWMVEGRYETHTAFQAALKLFSQSDRPTAVLASNDLMALGVLDAAHMRNLNVPRDLSVVGFDDILAAARTAPALTTMRQPARELGTLSVRHLLDSLSSEHVTPTLQRHLSPQLIIRSSTGSPSPGRP